MNFQDYEQLLEILNTDDFIPNSILLLHRFNTDEYTVPCVIRKRK